MFSEAAIILLTKLGNASVHMCKNVCTYSGKMYLKVWQVHLTNCWKTCCCLVRGRPCHHFILLIPSCFHELEEPLLYINQHFSTAEIKSKSPPACRISRNLWYCGGGLWQHASIGGDSGKDSRLPSYLPEPGLYFRHLRPTSPCRQLAGGALLPGCEAGCRLGEKPERCGAASQLGWHRRGLALQQPRGALPREEQPVLGCVARHWCCKHPFRSTGMRSCSC